VAIPEILTTEDNKNKEIFMQIYVVVPSSTN